jgi:hypothetical protein
MSEPKFYAACIIAFAGQISDARQGAWEFHKQDVPLFTDTVEQMLTTELSATGEAPATHYLCTRQDTLEHFARIEAYQQKLVAAGKPRVPVEVHVSEFNWTAVSDRADLKAKLGAHESGVLAKLRLRKIA